MIMVRFLEKGPLSLKFLSVEHFLDFAGLQCLVESLFHVHLGEHLATGRLAAHKRLKLRFLGVPIFLTVSSQDRVRCPLAFLSNGFDCGCRLTKAINRCVQLRFTLLVQSEWELLNQRRNR